MVFSSTFGGIFSHFDSSEVYQTSYQDVTWPEGPFSASPDTLRSDVGYWWLTDLTDVTLVSDDTFRRLYWWRWEDDEDDEDDEDHEDHEDHEDDEDDEDD